MCEIPVHKKVAFKFRHYKFVVHQLLNICWKKYCLDIFCSDCADLFLMLAFFHLFCLKWFLIQSCIIDYLKLTNKIHAPYLYRYKLLKHAVSKHFDVFSWLQTPYLTWLLLMKLYKYISESVYRQTGVCLGQMTCVFVCRQCYYWMTSIQETFSLLHGLPVTYLVCSLYYYVRWEIFFPILFTHFHLCMLWFYRGNFSLNFYKLSHYV